jgi:hypothetical protein
VPPPEDHTHNLPTAPETDPITDPAADTGGSDDRLVMQMIQDLAAFGGNGGFNRGKLGDGLVGGPKDWFA